MKAKTPKLQLIDSKDKWYPTSVDKLREYLGYVIIKESQFSEQRASLMRSNIAYNLQYVEFLDRVIKDINLSDVLWKQNVKSLFIHSSAIIEAILYYLVVKNGYSNTSVWESIKKISSNSYLINDQQYKIENEIFIKLESPRSIEMTFHQISNKVINKKLLGNVGDLYKEIGGIRKLRNKIHLHGITNKSDTDYNCFGNKEYLLIKKVLHGVLTSPIFSLKKDTSIFSYLQEE